MKILIVLCFALISTIAHSISEKNYADKYFHEVLPFFQREVSSSFFNSPVNNIKIHYGILKNTTAQNNGKVIVLLPGRAEPFIKYAEVAYDLYQSGYSFAFIDHRGQGLSDRLLSDKQKGHVEKFDHYVTDFIYFSEKIVPQELSGDLYILSHSMGGLIAAMAMDKKPKLFKKAILSAPMLEANTDPYPNWIADVYANTLGLFGQAQNYAPGKGPENPNIKFELDTATHSEVRFEMKKWIINHMVDTQVGGPTVHWVSESLKAGNALVGKFKKFSTPVMLFQASEDTYVRLPRQDQFCKQALSCKKIVLNKSRHEILMEVDSIRDEALDNIQFFLAQ